MAGVTEAGAARVSGVQRGLPGAVLFSCNLNRVRSPMAEGLMKLHFGDAVYVDSCGLHARTRRDTLPPGPDPFAVAVMDELGVDLSRHRPKNFNDLEDTSFDVVISLSPEAHHRAGELARARAIDVEYWPTLDPTLVTGQRDQMLSAYRDVRDALEKRLRARFGEVRTFGG
jgi:protein-tyrosine-phosphatase